MSTIVLQHARAGQPLEVVVEKTPTRTNVRFGEVNAHVESGRIRPGAGWLRLHGRIVPYYVNRDAARIEVWLDGRIHAFQIVDRAARRGAAGPTGGVLGDVAAPMPGTIVALKVGRGEAFEAHQPLVVMESMKMEMILSAPAAGRVKDVLCSVGQLVEMNAPLLRLEANDE